MMDQIEEEIDDPLQKMKDAFIEMFSRYETDPEFRQIEELFVKIEFASIIREDEELRERFHNDMFENKKKISNILRKSQQEGKIRNDIKIEGLTL